MGRASLSKLSQSAFFRETSAFLCVKFRPGTVAAVEIVAMGPVAQLLILHPSTLGSASREIGSALPTGDCRLFKGCSWCSWCNGSVVQLISFSFSIGNSMEISASREIRFAEIGFRAADCGLLTAGW